MKLKFIMLSSLAFVFMSSSFVKASKNNQTGWFSWLTFIRPTFPSISISPASLDGISPRTQQQELQDQWDADQKQEAEGRAQQHTILKMLLQTHKNCSFDAPCTLDSLEGDTALQLVRKHSTVFRRLTLLDEEDAQLCEVHRFAKNFLPAYAQKSLRVQL